MYGLEFSFFTLDLIWILCPVINTFITRPVPVITWANILFRCYYSRKLSVNWICWTVAISFRCVVLHAWCCTVSLASIHTSWRTLCLNYEDSLFSLCVCLTQYTICLNCHNHRKWDVTHRVTQECCVLGGNGMMIGGNGMMILSQIFVHLG